MTAVITIAAIASLIQVLLAITGAAAIAWLVSPSSPCQPVARWWRRRIVVAMAAVPGGAW